MKIYATWYNNLGDNFMIQIPDKSYNISSGYPTFIFIQRDFKAKKDCLGIQVLTWSSWLSSFLSWTNKIRY